MKPRNREINIFNMSLLDVLCGALGAFCFLMLALFPYYAKGSAAKTPEDAAKLQQEIDQLKQDLAKAKSSQPADLAKENEELKKRLADAQKAAPGKTGEKPTPLVIRLVNNPSGDMSFGLETPPDLAYPNLPGLMDDPPLISGRQTRLKWIPLAADNNAVGLLVQSAVPGMYRLNATPKQIAMTFKGGVFFGDGSFEFRPVKAQRGQQVTIASIEVLPGGIVKLR
jgi:hypothetical protein